MAIERIESQPTASLGSRAHLLFTLDGQGNLLTANEHAGALAPFVYIHRGEAGSSAHFRADAPPELRDSVARLLAASPPNAGWENASPLGEALRSLVREFLTAPVLYHGPVFRFPPPLMAPMGAMLFYPGNAPLLHPGLATLGPELRYRRPAYAVMRQGQAVSICYTARASAHAAEAGVETVETYRGQGCAQLAVDAWASAVRARRLSPRYSTSWENTASLAVARKLELVAIGEDIHVSATKLASRNA